MNTFIIDPDTGKVLAILAGQKRLHSVRGDQVAIEWPGSNTASKIGKEIDGEWQLIDDVEAITESARRVKVIGVVNHKKIIIGNGFLAEGEVFVTGSWVPETITIPFSGDISGKISRISRRMREAGSPQNLFRHGRFTILLPGKKRKAFTSINELTTLIDSYETVIDTLEAIETEKIEELTCLESIEEINNYDSSAGWEELNG